jgi:hypothetical protein
MPLDWNVIPTLIPALSGLGGVWLGGSLISKRERMKEVALLEKETSYLAILVVSHLDRFVDSCVAVVGDDGTSYGQPAGEGGIYQTTVKTPDFDPLTLSVNWKSLPSNLMYEILSLPYQIETLNRTISNAGDYDDPPEYASFFWERQHGYAAMGLEFVRIAKLLRQHANLPPLQSINGEWSRDKFLSDQKIRFEKMRDDHQRTMQPVPLASATVNVPGAPAG